MKRILVVGVLGAGLIGAWLWWSSDVRKLERRLSEIEELFGKSGPEDQLTAFGKTRQIVGLFAPGFVVLARPYQGSIADTAQLAAVIQSYRSSAGRIDVASGERSTEIDSERGTAETRATFAVSGERGGGPGGDRFRARIAWVKLEGEWRIQEFEILEIVERGGMLGF